MRKRVALAVLVSFFLIGTAFWTRLSSKNKSPELAVVESAVNQGITEDYVKDVFGPSTDANTDSEPLTTTDIIGRDLLASYIDMAASGQVTPANLDALAQKYADSIPTLHTSEKIDLLDLKIVEDTVQNLSAYSDELDYLYENQAQALEQSDSSDEYIAEARKNIIVFQKVLNGLKGMPVPKSLASAHLQLVNTRISMLDGLKATLQMDSDPLTAMSGLIAIHDDLDGESVILNSIDKILISHGV